MSEATRPKFATIFPIAGLALAFALARGEQYFAMLPGSLAFAPGAAALILLIGCVLATLQHAEVASERFGEPIGTLFLTIAVTLIEVAIIVSMIEHGSDDPTEAREALFSAIMIVCNGVVGICLLLGAVKHHEQELHPLGASAYLAVLIALSILTLILPNYTRSTFGPTLSPLQLGFFGALSAFLYAAFLFIQTVRHRSYFMEISSALVDRRHAGRPTAKQTGFALLWLLASLLGVVFLSRRVVADLEDSVRGLGVEDVNAVSGAAVALLVLLPESLNAIRAAMRNALQTALNSALGSVLATVGLTVPAIAFVSLATDHDLVLGLEKRDMVMLILTLMLSIVSFGTGRTNVLTGIVHLVVFSAYVFLLFVP